MPLHNPDAACTGTSPVASPALNSCGSMTHKVADCLERPRARGAKLTGKHIAADDKVDSVHLSTYDSKRDRYNGYDTAEYTKVVERYEAVDAIRQVGVGVCGLRVCDGCVRWWVLLQGPCVEEQRQQRGTQAATQAAVLLLVCARPHKPSLCCCCCCVHAAHRS